MAEKITVWYKRIGLKFSGIGELLIFYWIQEKKLKKWMWPYTEFKYVF